MSKPVTTFEVPRLALTVEEACAALGVSWDFWSEHVAHDVRIVRAGRRKLVPVAELQRWLEVNAGLALDDPHRHASLDPHGKGSVRGARQSRASQGRAA